MLVSALIVKRVCLALDVCCSQIPLQECLTPILSFLRLMVSLRSYSQVPRHFHVFITIPSEQVQRLTQQHTHAFSVLNCRL
jgi:hypothetical protein